MNSSGSCRQKKVAIVTVYYTTNCGSVLQALALKEALTSLGVQVEYVSTQNRFSALSTKNMMKDCVKAILSHSSPLKVISKYIEDLSFVRDNFGIYKCDESAQYVCIGSDTVWDVESRYFLESQDIFWWRTASAEKVFSYAASIANSSYEMLDSLRYPVNRLGSMTAISVRDEYTKNYIESRTGIVPRMVCDPTILVGGKFFERLCSGNQPKGDYILLYLFDELSEGASRAIRKYANDHQLSIISLGKRISIADGHVESTVPHFLDCFINARRIVTNTFHGTIFSILFEKRFVSMNYGKKKVSDLLLELGLVGHLGDEGSITDILDMEIDYEVVDRRIESMRAESIAYLQEVLEL